MTVCGISEYNSELFPSAVFVDDDLLRNNIMRGEIYGSLLYGKK